jgi:hypothetical protein
VDKARTEIMFRVFSDLVRVATHPTAYGSADSAAHEPAHTTAFSAAHRAAVAAAYEQALRATHATTL